MVNALTLFITVKAITKLNQGLEFEITIKKINRLARVLQTTQNLVISRCCFGEDGKEMYKDL